MSDEHENAKPIETAGRLFSLPNLPTFYANNGRVALGFHDIRLYFIEARPVPAKTTGAEDAPANIIELCCVIMSPEYVKALAEGLTKAVATYEEKYGKLRPRPPDEEK